MPCVSGGTDDASPAVAEGISVSAPDSWLTLFKRGWEGHLRQYTEAKTVEVEMGREGMYYREFPVMFDWFHNGEGLSAFNLQELSDPDDRAMQIRARRYAGFYMNEDPQAPNYDPEHKIIYDADGGRHVLARYTPIG